jgi:FkbM family methyltransferase
VSIEAFNLLKSHIREPIILVDVGARWGALDFWKLYGHKAKIFCFEADEEEADRLKSQNTASNIEYIPFALGADGNGLTLNLTEGPGCSSVYEPIESLYTDFPGCNVMRPIRAAQCRSIGLDEFCRQRNITKIHALKLDTQGSELDILKGAESALKGCVFINIEVEFNQLYKHQPLFCDVDRHLRDRGFVLWRLNNLAHYSKRVMSGAPHPILLAAEPGSHQYVPVENGQLFWADAFYVQEAAVPTNDQPLDFDDAIAGACLVSQWRLWDLAIEMVRKSGANDLLEKLSTLVPPGAPHRTLAEENEAQRQKIEVLEREARELRAHIDALKDRPATTWLRRLLRWN